MTSLQGLAPAAAGLTLSMLLEKTDGQTLRQMLPWLSATTGWSPAQASIILRRVLQGGYQVGRKPHVTKGDSPPGIGSTGLVIHHSIEDGGGMYARGSAFGFSQINLFIPALPSHRPRPKLYAELMCLAMGTHSHGDSTCKLAVAFHTHYWGENERKTRLRKVSLKDNTRSLKYSPSPVPS